MAKRNIVDQVAELAALGTAVLDAVKVSGLARTRSRRSTTRKVEGNPGPVAPRRKVRNPLRGTRPVQPTE